MLTEQEKQQLASKYAVPTKAAIKPLTALMALTLGKQDLIGFTFICDVVGQIMEAAIEIAKDIQKTRIGEGESVH